MWITHLKRREGEAAFKLPATRALEPRRVAVDAPEVPIAVDAALPAEHTFREIAYEEHGGVGYLHFDFYNGAMSTEQCRRLRDAYLLARSRRETKVIVLMGGADFFSNGIHLNVIEAADDPAMESWLNLQAIDDVVREIVETDSHLVISALAGDAAAGGVPFALAADRVVAREDVVLNPYYRHMGGLYGSEYWTYLLPRRVGADDGRAPHQRALHARGHPRGGRDGAARRRLRLHRRRLRRPGPRSRRATRPRPAPRPSSSRTSGARGRATSRSSRCARTATRSSRAPTAASSARTAATTRRATASCTSSARPARCPTPAVEDRLDH